MKPDTKAAQARALHKEGLSIAEISKQITLAHSSVKDTVNNPTANGKLTHAENIYRRNKVEGEWALRQRIKITCAKCGGEWYGRYQGRVGTFRGAQYAFRRHNCEKRIRANRKAAQ